MNEKINKLWDQAVNLIQDNNDGDWSLDACKDKFAELIIRDCMDAVDGYTMPRTFTTHYDAVEQIEALFGIKHNEVEP